MCYKELRSYSCSHSTVPLCGAPMRACLALQGAIWCVHILTWAYAWSRRSSLSPSTSPILQVH